jgi:hypothetical protein
LAHFPEKVALQALNEDPRILFTDIYGLSSMLTAYCNLHCVHCCVDYERFLDENHRLPIMDELAALRAIDLIPLAKQYTDSGGEVWLLDAETREYALENGLIGKGLAKKFERYDYLERLVERQAERLRTDWNAVSSIDISSEERFLRVPTNGYLLPWLDRIDLSDMDAIKNSRLYEVLKRFRGILFQMSIGPFQQWEYLRWGKGDINKSLIRRVEEIIAVNRVLAEDFNREQGLSNPPNFAVGFMFTQTQPKLKKITDAEFQQLDDDLAQRYAASVPSILEGAMPTHDPDKCPIVKQLEGLFLIEIQPTLLNGEAAKNHLLWASSDFKARPSRTLGEIDELYMIPETDGKTLKFYSNTVHYYNNGDNPLFVLRLQ